MNNNCVHIIIQLVIIIQVLNYFFLHTQNNVILWMLYGYSKFLARLKVSFNLPSRLITCSCNQQYFNKRCTLFIITHMNNFCQWSRTCLWVKQSWKQYKQYRAVNRIGKKTFTFNPTAGMSRVGLNNNYYFLSLYNPLKYAHEIWNKSVV